MRRLITITAVLVGSLLFAAAPVAADTGPGPEDPPPQEIVLQLTIDSTGSVNGRTGQAVIRGTVTCDVPAVAWVGGEVRQQVGRLHTIHGWFGTEVPCSATPTAWSAIARGDQGKFAGGPVSVDAWSEAFTENAYGFQFASASVRLSR
jgi:hypothetical protein